ncbi:MucBP domain-containing protein [Enterococcus faecalis]
MGRKAARIEKLEQLQGERILKKKKAIKKLMISTVATGMLVPNFIIGASVVNAISGDEESNEQKIDQSQFLETENTMDSSDTSSEDIDQVEDTPDSSNETTSNLSESNVEANIVVGEESDDSKVDESKDSKRVPTISSLANNVNDFQYQINSESAIIIGYSGSSSDIVIPDEIEGYPVTAIGTHAFSGNNIGAKITSVVFPESLVTIGDYAFYEQELRGEIVLPSKVETLGSQTFSSNFIDSVKILGKLSFQSYAFQFNNITKLELNDDVNNSVYQGMLRRQFINSTINLGASTTFKIADLVDLNGQNNQVKWYSNSNNVEVSGDTLIFKGTTPSYSFTLSGEGANGEIYQADISVTADYSYIDAKDSSVPLTGKWSPEDNFIFAKDINGAVLAWGQSSAGGSGQPVVASGNVDTNIPGDYQVTYTIGTASKTITVTVNPEAEAGPIEVKHVDESGNELSASETLNGKVGLPYETKAKSINGWTVKTTPDNATGTFSEEAQTVTYVYERTDAKPVTVNYVDEEGNPHILTTPRKIVSTAKSEKLATQKSYLPKTGEQKAGLLTLIGVLLIFSTSGYIYFRKKVKR